MVEPKLQDIQQLIPVLEKAERGSDDLNLQMGKALGIAPQKSTLKIVQGSRRWLYQGTGCNVIDFTTSLDATENFFPKSSVKQPWLHSSFSADFDKDEDGNRIITYSAHATCVGANVSCYRIATLPLARAINILKAYEDEILYALKVKS